MQNTLKVTNEILTDKNFNRQKISADFSSTGELFYENFHLAKIVPKVLGVQGQ